MIPNIRELRGMAGLTQGKVSQASGINRAKLSLAEHGEIELSVEEGILVRKVLLQAIRVRSERINAFLSEIAGEELREWS